MLKAQAATLVRRHVDDCFRFVADDFFRNYPRWSPEVVELTPLSRGPVRVGSLGRQVRVDFGRRSADTFRVIAMERGRRLTFEGISSPFLIDYRFETLDGQTRLVFTFVLSRLDLWMRPFEHRIRRVAQEGAVRVGSLARQVRVDFGRRTADTFRVIALERGRRLTFQGVSSPFLVDYRFETLDGQTRLVFTFVLSRLDLWMRPFERRIRRAAQEGADRVVINLKGLIETDCAGGVG